MLFNSAKNTNFLQYSLGQGMSILMDWSKANKLSLNVDKTLLLKFWPRDKPFTINVEGTKIKNLQHTRFLGVLVDECLNWKEHTNNLYNKILNNKRLLSNAKNLLPKLCLLKIYYAHVYSHLIYNTNVWGTMCPKTSQNSLYRLQQECLKIIDNKNMKSADESFKKHKIIQLPDLIMLYQEKMGYMVTNEMMPQPIIDLFHLRGGKNMHRYPTRNKHLPNIQPHQSVMFNNSFLCKSLLVYNNPPGIKKGNQS